MESSKISFKMNRQSQAWLDTLITTTCRSLRLKSCLGYRVNSRTARATWLPCLKKQKEGCIYKLRSLTLRPSMSEVIDLIPNVSLSPSLSPSLLPLSKLDALHRKAMEEPSWLLLSKRSQCEKAPSYMTLMTQHSERLTLQGQ